MQNLYYVNLAIGTHEVHLILVYALLQQFLDQQEFYAVSLQLGHKLQPSLQYHLRIKTRDYKNLI